MCIIRVDFKIGGEKDLVVFLMCGLGTLLHDLAKSFHITKLHHNFSFWSNHKNTSLWCSLEFPHSTITKNAPKFLSLIQLIAMQYLVGGWVIKLSDPRKLHNIDKMMPSISKIGLWCRIYLIQFDLWLGLNFDTSWINLIALERCSVVD